MPEHCQCCDCRARRLSDNLDQMKEDFPEEYRREKLRMGQESTGEFAKEEAMLKRTGMTEREARAEGLI